MNVLILCGTIALQLVNHESLPVWEEKQPCLSLKLNRRHYGLLRTNDKDDDENQPFYLLFIGKRGASRSGGDNDNDKDW